MFSQKRKKYKNLVWASVLTAVAILALVALCLSLFLKLSPIIIVVIAGASGIIYKSIMNKKANNRKEKE